jgi:hypothetical protein
VKPGAAENRSRFDQMSMIGAFFSPMKRPRSKSDIEAEVGSRAGAI